MSVSYLYPSNPLNDMDLYMSVKTQGFCKWNI